MALSKCPAESSVLSIQSSAVSCEWCGAEGLAACTASEGRKSTMGERVRINGGHYIPWCKHQLGDQEIDWANNRLTSAIQGCNWETRKTMAARETESVSTIPTWYCLLVSCIICSTLSLFTVFRSVCVYIYFPARVRLDNMKCHFVLLRLNQSGGRIEQLKRKKKSFN